MFRRAAKINQTYQLVQFVLNFGFTCFKQNYSGRDAFSLEFKYAVHSILHRFAHQKQYLLWLKLKNASETNLFLSQKINFNYSVISCRNFNNLTVAEVHNHS